MSSRIVAIDARLAFGTSTGDSTYWTGLLSGLRAVDPNVQFLLFSDAEMPSFVTRDPRFRSIVLPKRRNMPLAGRWWSLIDFPLAARKLGADVIHTQYTLSPMVGQRGVTTVHDVSFFIGPEWFPARHRALLRTTIPASCRRASQVITVSQTSKSEIERMIPAARGKTHVTYNACPDWVRRIPRVDADALVRSKFGIEEPFFLTVGTRWPRKNMELAVQSVANLNERYPHRLLITGKTGWGSQELGKRGMATGYVDEETLSALYSAATLYLAPSRHEGFGIPLLEAFRCGCPVLCSTGGALPEVAGDAAVVEPSWRVEDWTSRIESLIGDASTLHALRERGIERERQFSWESTARKTLEVYEKVTA